MMFGLRVNQMRIACFASGNGTNFKTLLEAIADKKIYSSVAIFITNNSECEALKTALKNGIKTQIINHKTHPQVVHRDQAIRDVLLKYQIDLVLLLGYLKQLGPLTIEAFRGKILNIHPALLPQFGGAGFYGIHVHRAVIESKMKKTGVTIHFVDEIYDHGAILAQRELPIFEHETPEQLQKRVLELEHQLLIETIIQLEQHKKN